MLLFISGFAVGTIVAFFVTLVICSAGIKARHETLVRGILHAYASAADQLAPNETLSPRDFDEYVDPNSAATIELVRGLFLELPKRIADRS